MPGKNVLLVEYFCTDDTTLVFGVRAEWTEPRVKEIEKPVKDIRRETVRLFGADRDATGKVIRKAHDKIEKLDEAEWQNIFGPFIEPIREWAKEDDIVWLVPHDALHYLPLHALRLDGRYLIEQYPVVYSPSASVMKYCQLKRTGKREHALVLGDSLGDLKYSNDEALVIAEMFGTKPFLQSNATKKLLKEKLQTERDQINVLHLSCHGEFDSSQPLKSRIKFAKDEDKETDLTSEEIFDLDMRAELVVLSACESGVNDRKPGDELIGLTRSLIYAGTPSVIVSLWSVRDVSTILLMQKFYEEWLKERDTPITKAEALQQAQLATMRMTAYDLLSKKEEFEVTIESLGGESRSATRQANTERSSSGQARSNADKSSSASDEPYRPYAKLYSWAPFILVGDWK